MKMGRFVGPRFFFCPLLEPATRESGLMDQKCSGFGKPTCTVCGAGDMSAVVARLWGEHAMCHFSLQSVITVTRPFSTSLCPLLPASLKGSH